MEVKKFEEICERVKNAEHCVISTIDKNDECYIHFKSSELEMRFMLKAIIEGLTHDDKSWLLHTILLELNKKGEEENGKPSC